MSQKSKIVFDFFPINDLLEIIMRAMKDGNEIHTMTGVTNGCLVIADIFKGYVSFSKTPSILAEK